MFSGVGCKYPWARKQGILCDFHIEVAKKVAKRSFRTHGPASRGSCLTSTLKWLKRSQSVRVYIFSSSVPEARRLDCFVLQVRLSAVRGSPCRDVP